jgi:hypothetical protein
MIYQLRMIIAEQFLWWSAKIAPKDDEQGMMILSFVKAYMEEAIKNSEQTK